MTDRLEYDAPELLDIPPVPLRVPGKCRQYNPSCDDFLFQVLDVNMGFDTQQKQPWGKKDKEEGNENKKPKWGVKETIVYVHGVTDGGETACVQFRGYQPCFYLSMPEKEGILWAEKLMADMEDCEDVDTREDAFSWQVVYRLPTVGFTNEEKRPFIFFQFTNLPTYFSFRKYLSERFPPPTRLQVERGEYLNDVILCEAYSVEQMKFMDWTHIVSAGWVRLPATTYDFLEERSIAMHNWFANELEGVQDKQNIPPVLIDSVDIEQIRHISDMAMPDPTDRRDCCVSIGHALQPSDRSTPPYYIVWTWIHPQRKLCQVCKRKPAVWGVVADRIPSRCPACRKPEDTLMGKVSNDKYYEIPSQDHDGKPFPFKNLVVMAYDSEEEMLWKWVLWWSGRLVSSDVVIGWNIYGYDLRAIYQRIEVFPGIQERAKVWGRLIGWQTKLKVTQIESKAISFNKYHLTPSPGRIYIDDLVLFQRDVTLRLHDFKLETVAQHFFKTGKDPIHYSEIKKRFYGNPREFGELLAYNVKDCDLVLRLFLHASHWPKVVNVARVNRVLLDLLCPRGQQLRVYGGFHYVAQKNGYVVWRPHYHPLLDGGAMAGVQPKKQKGHEEDGDIDGVVEMWNRFMYIRSAKGCAPSMRTIQSRPVEVDEDEIVIPRRKREYGAPLSTGNITSLGWMGPEDEKRDTRTSTGSKRFGLKDVDMLEKGIGKKRDLDGGSNTPSKKKKENTKGFEGGFVMDPKRGFWENIPTLDFNSLYPNIMITYKFDPALLVLDVERYGPQACPDVEYIEIRFDEHTVFYFAKGRWVTDANGNRTFKDFQGVMIQHTANLIAARKVAQGVMGSFATRVENERKRLVRILYDIDREWALKLLAGFLESEKDETKKKKISLALSDGGTDDRRVKLLIRYCKLGTLTERARSCPKRPADHPLIACRIREEFETALSALLPSTVEWEKMSANLVRGEPLSLEETFAEQAKFLKEGTTNQNDRGLELFKNYVFGGTNPIKKDIVRISLEILAEYLKKKDNTDVLAECLLLTDRFVSEHTNYNSKQNELKVGCNSTFGFLGAGGIVTYEADPNCLVCYWTKCAHGHPVKLCKTGCAAKVSCDHGVLKRKGMMPVMPISACVTFIGRLSIERSKNYVETKYPGWKVLYADTDSLFIDMQLPKTHEGLVQSFTLAKKVAAEITALFPGSMRIVHEKTARVLILYESKCYVLDKYESIDDVGKLEIKGLQVTKRDCALFVNKLGKKALEMIVRKRDVEAAKHYVVKTLAKVVDGKYTLKQLADKFVIYKKLAKKTYDNAVGHAKLAERINARKPGLGPKTGESVKFLYVDVKDPDNKFSMEVPSFLFNASFPQEAADTWGFPGENRRL